MSGPFGQSNVDCTGDTLEVVNSAFTLATTNDGQKYILGINQAFCHLDPYQNEALLAPHQCRDNGVIVDNCAKRHLKEGENGDTIPGTQSIKVPDHRLEFSFDGHKCYYRIEKPTEEDLQTYPTVWLTSSKRYEPSKRKHSIRRVYNNDAIARWRANLGFPTFDTTINSLENSTQMVKTLQAETREYMRNHTKTRVHCLRPKRIDDVMFTDTFYSGIVSIRSKKCFQIFAYKNSHMTVARTMKREAEAPENYEDIIIEFGAPYKTVTDNAKVLTSNKWKNINRKYVIQTGKTVPYHQQQNFAENEGGNLKFALMKLFHNTPHAPSVYWCYGIEFLEHVRRHLSKSGLNNRSPLETVYGDTEDLSIFRFPWFAPVWYYDPLSVFPRDTMQPGFILGIASNTGDGFAYTILPVAKVEDIPIDSLQSCRPIVRSIVRDRELDSMDAPTIQFEDEHVYFYDIHGNEIYGEHELNGNDVDDYFEDDHVATSQSEINNLTTNFHSSSMDDIRNRDRLSIHDSNIHSIDEDYVDPIPFDHQEEWSSEEPIQNAYVSEEPNSEEPVTACLQTDTPDPEPPLKRQRTNPIPSVTQDSDDEQDCQIPDEFDQSDMGNFDKMADQVNVIFDQDDDKSDVEAILDHRVVTEVLELKVKYFGDNDENMCHWHPIDLVKDEDAQAVANYILSNDIVYRNIQEEQRWARYFLRALKRTLRRLRRTSFLGFESKTFVPNPTSTRAGWSDMSGKQRSKIRRAEMKENKKKKSNDIKYGIEVPKNWDDIRRIDAAAGDTKWADAVSKEVAALIQHECFQFLDKSKFKPPSDFQNVRLHFVYEVKPDLRQKARLVCDGSRVDPRGLSTRATVVKGISVRLLDLIADAQDLEVVCGDIGNAFIQAHTREKVFSYTGPEFGVHAGKIAVIIRALYGLTTSAERFHKLFADFLRSVGFTPTRFDRDVWMRMRDDETGYDYICTHVDDFKVVAKEPMVWIDRIAGAFLIKEHGPRNYYLGNNYTFHDGEDMWTYNAQTYETEAIAKVERIFGCIAKERTPLPTSECHPEMDESELLGLDDHRKFQMLLGMLQWLASIGRPDLSQVVSSLNRFGAAPRRYHLDLAIRVFGYIKWKPHPNIAIDSRPIEFVRNDPDFTPLIPDFLEDYPHASEEMDEGFPLPFGPVLQTTILVDSDHAHDKKTRRSLTGLLAYVGSTPVQWLSKRQGSIASSTYAAEFSALRTATEEAISLRYMLRCLGCNVPADGSCPTKIFGDNLSVILNSQNPAADLAKKHVAISFHSVREAVAARIIEPYWLKGQWNLSDIMTKQIPSTEFNKHCDGIFWTPDFHIRTENKFDQFYDEF